MTRNIKDIEKGIKKKDEGTLRIFLNVNLSKNLRHRSTPILIEATLGLQYSSLGFSLTIFLFFFFSL